MGQVKEGRRIWDTVEHPRTPTLEDMCSPGGVRATELRGQYLTTQAVVRQTRSGRASRFALAMYFP
ncbi:hypothetical protein BH23GEM11_BH23GEM11_19090 [soil metagenome]